MKRSFGYLVLIGTKYIYEQWLDALQGYCATCRTTLSLTESPCGVSVYDHILRMITVWFNVEILRADIRCANSPVTIAANRNPFTNATLTISYPDPIPIFLDLQNICAMMVLTTKAAC
jgi:hypothetical protein